MKTVFVFALPMMALFFLSCNSNKRKITSRAWNYSYMEYKEDGVAENPHMIDDGYTQFNKNGEVTGEFSIYICDYRISGDKIYFNADEEPGLIRFESPNSFSVSYSGSTSDNKQYSSKRIYNATDFCKKNSFDSLIYNLSKEFNIYDTDTTGTGQILFSISERDRWNDNFIPEPYKASRRIKAIIDKTLNSVPTKREEMKFSAFDRCLYDYYEWDTPNVEVKVENDFKSDYSDPSKTVLRSRMWVYGK